MTKTNAAESNTRWAQGGIASVLRATDDFAAHVADTLEAGAGLCDRARVESMVAAGPERVRELLDWGVAFSREGGTWPWAARAATGSAASSTWPTSRGASWSACCWRRRSLIPASACSRTTSR